MTSRKLISPEFRVTVGDYILKDGIEVECFSSRESHLDWCRVELGTAFDGAIFFHNMDEAKVELGYDDDYDTLIDGYVRNEAEDYWKELMIKDDLMKLERVAVKGTFLDCTPQDIIRYILTCAGISSYKLDETVYPKKDRVAVPEMNGLKAIAEINAAWGLSKPYYFQNRIFCWGITDDQTELYVIEEDETILSLRKSGTLWEAETIAVPWIHHSQEIQVRHSKYSGVVTVEKTIIRSDRHGAVHMFIYFKG